MQLVTVLGLVASLLAQNEQLTCKAIVDKSLATNNFGLDEAVAKMTMQISGKSGAVRERQVVIKSKDLGALNRTMVRFLSPPDVAGTGFLVLENDGRDDDQYIYLPALGKVKRINSSQRGSSFMGTDFTYADLESRNLEDSECTRQADTELDKQPVFLITSMPKKEDEQYSKTISWIHKEHFIPLKVEFYDKSGKLEKVLTAKRIKKVDGRWVTMESEMSNQQKGTRTTILINEIDFKSQVPDEDFTTRALERG